MKTSNPILRRKTSANKPIFYMPTVAGGSAKDVISGVQAQCVIAGTRYGVVNGVVTSFGPNIPAVEDNGLRACPAFTQYFLNNQTPVTQSITLPAGSYCLWVEGSGSASYNGNTATAGHPVVFTLASSIVASCTITGTVTKAMLNTGFFMAPFTPTSGTPVAVEAETATTTTGMSFDLDNAKLSRIKKALRGPNAQGHIELKFLSNFNWNSLGTAGVYNNIFSLGSSNVTGLYWNQPTGGGLWRWNIRDGTNVAYIENALVTLGTVYTIIIDYGTHPTGQKMRIMVNGVSSTIVPFLGSWGADDLTFFYSPTILSGWIVKDSLKVLNRPIW